MADDTRRDLEGELASAGGFARLAMDLEEADDLAASVALVVRLARRVVPCDAAGVILRGPNSHLSVAGADEPRVAVAFQLEIDCGEGPLAWMNTSQQTVVVADTFNDRRWKQWGPQAAQLGLRSMLGIRLRTTRAELGMLNLYSAVPGRFADADTAAAIILASHASVAIVASLRAATLMQAIESRTVIGQAQGILMERFGLDAEQAFAVLRRYSQDGNIKLHRVAAQIVATGQLFLHPRPAPPSRRD